MIIEEMNIEKVVIEATLAAVKKLYHTDEVAQGQIQVQKTRKEFEGDVTIVAFPLLRWSKKSPEATAEELGAYLQEHVEEVVNYNVVKGFLNLSIANRFWLNFFEHAMQHENYGVASPSGITKMVEYSSPNTNKPLHLGHLRNNFLGYSVAEILKANGHEVVKVQIINDRGIHICKSMLAWLKWGDGATPESVGIKGDKLVGDYYVKFDQAYKTEIQELVEQKQQAYDVLSNESDIKALKATLEKREKKAKKEPLTVLEKEQLIAVKTIYEQATKEAPIILEAQDMLRKWEAKDPEVYQLWETMNGWVYDGFDVTYKTMGVDFDKLYYESETYLLGKEQIDEGLEKGVFYQKDDGSVWCDLSQEKLDDKLVLRSDGTAVYMTQDIGTAILRYNDYPSIDGITYTVGNEQDHHFKVLFIILDKLGYSWAKNCRHLSYGMVELPEGKMKSREGTVVDADDLMAEMVKNAAETAEELGKLEGLTPQEKEHVYRSIGIGAIKYYILKVDPERQMLFNPKESIDFNGNTSAFISFTYVRTRAILRKVEEMELNYDVSEVTLVPEERELIKAIYDFPVAIKEAGEAYSPAIIANYTYELVRLYNVFYQHVSILKEENETIKQFRIALSTKTGTVIKTAMKLLGIDVPERM